MLLRGTTAFVEWWIIITYVMAGKALSLLLSVVRSQSERFD